MQADFIVSDIVLPKDDKEEFHLILKINKHPNRTDDAPDHDATRFES